MKCQAQLGRGDTVMNHKINPTVLKFYSLTEEVFEYSILN